MPTEKILSNLPQQQEETEEAIIQAPEEVVPALAEAASASASAFDLFSGEGVIDLFNDSINEEIGGLGAFDWNGSELEQRDKDLEDEKLRRQALFQEASVIKRPRPTLKEMVRHSFCFAQTLYSQIEIDRVIFNIDLFQNILLAGAKLHEFLLSVRMKQICDTTDMERDQIKIFCMRIINLIAKFGSDGGMANIRLVRSEICKIQNALMHLQNFFTEVNRNCTHSEIVESIPDVLFLVMQKMVCLANVYCYTALNVDDSENIGHFRYTWFQLLKRDQNLIEKFTTILDTESGVNLWDIKPTVLNGCEFRDVVDINERLCDIVIPYHNEYFRKILPIYIELLENTRITFEDKLSVLRYVWIRLYENIHDRSGLYSSSTAVEVRKQYISNTENSAFSILRQMFVHAGEHPNFNAEFDALLRSEEFPIIPLSIRLLKRVLADLDTNDFKQTIAFLKTDLEQYCEKTVCKMPICNVLKMNLKSEFLIIEIKEVFGTSFSNSYEYLQSQLDFLQNEVIKFFNCELTIEDKIAFAEQRSSLTLSDSLQVKYIKMVNFIHSFGMCYNALLKNEALDPINYAVDQAMTIPMGPGNGKKETKKKNESDDERITRRTIKQQEKRIGFFEKLMSECGSKEERLSNEQKLKDARVEYQGLLTKANKESPRKQSLPAFQIDRSLAYDVGNLDERLTEIRALAIRSILVRNSAVHQGIHCNVFDMLIMIYTYGNRVNQLLYDVVSDLQEKRHVCQRLEA